MNLFKRELRAHLKSIILWSLGILLMVAGGMGKYSAFSNAGQSVNDIFRQMPQSVQVIFGLQAFDLSTASGFYGVMFLYLSLMASIHATLLGSELLFKEERDKTAEFLMVKPIKRSAVITAKLMAGLINLIIFNLVTVVLSVSMISAVGKGESVNAEIYLLMFGMFLLQLIFFSLGMFFSSVYKFSRFPGGLTAIVLFGTFILSFAVDLIKEIEFMKYVTPFQYFGARTVLRDGRIEPIYMLLTVIIVTVSILFTYRNYSRRDLRL